MSDLTPKLAADVVAACTASLVESAAALTRALDAEFTLGAVKQDDYPAETMPAGFDGPGLLVLLTFGDAGLAICLPDSSAMLPSWCAAPDAAGDGKLATLAQELRTFVVPDTLVADQVEARWVESLTAALTAAGLSPDAALVTIDATSAEKTAQLSLVWPLPSPAATFATTNSAAKTSESAAPTASQKDAAADKTGKAAGPPSFSQLPHYSRSLLKIQIPISVQLAGKKETVKEVVELVPGSIIKFDKGCDELLQMIVGGQSVAEGEAVKIGDKFGFRVTGLLLPREHFVPVKRPRAG